jgi:hypothetical protein
MTQDSISEACMVVQAAAAGKSKAEIRRMLTEEFMSRDAPPLTPELVEVAVQRIAAGTYTPGQPLVYVRRSGLLSVAFVRQAIRRAFDKASTEHGAEQVFPPQVVWTSQAAADAWPLVSKTLPHPPGRVLYAPDPDQVPPPARLLPDPDLRERLPDLFEPHSGQADLLFVWLEELEESEDAVAVCCLLGRIGIVEAADAEAYLPLIRAAAARGEVVAAAAGLCLSARDLRPATVRVVPDRSAYFRTGTASPDG